ncbi:MAG: hypothetical protein ABR553_10670, partial [Gammaproteobacteria bacterium]
MQTDNISIDTSNLRGEIAPLYNRYPGQTEPQPSYVEMDEDGFVSTNYSGEIGNGVPSYVWHGRTLRFSVPSDVRGDALADLLEGAEVVALLERIHAGHEVEWDGNNHRGYLDDDAQEAQGELEHILGELSGGADEGGGVWEASDWMDAAGLLGWWSGCPLDEAVFEVGLAAESENVHLDGDIEAVLLDWAEQAVDRDEPRLDAHHLAALVESGRINTETAAEYAEVRDGAVELGIKRREPRQIIGFCARRRADGQARVKPLARHD